MGSSHHRLGFGPNYWQHFAVKTKCHQSLSKVKKDNNASYDRFEDKDD